MVQMGDEYGHSKVSRHGCVVCRCACQQEKVRSCWLMGGPIIQIVTGMGTARGPGDCHAQATCAGASSDIGSVCWVKACARYMWGTQPERQLEAVSWSAHPQMPGGAGPWGEADARNLADLLRWPTLQSGKGTGHSRLEPPCSGVCPCRYQTNILQPGCRAAASGF